MVPITNAGIDTSICFGESVVLSAIGADTYTWDQNVNNGVSFVPAQSLVYHVIGTSTNGCSSIDSISLIVNTLPSVSLGNDVTLCASETPYALTPNTSGGNLTYNWSNGATNNTIDVLLSGNYSLEITDGNNCSNIDTVEVVVNENPTVSLPADTTICNSQFPYIVAAIASNGANLTWSNGSTSSNVTITSAETLSIEALNSFGCYAYDSVTISADPCLSLEETAVELIQVYPNPFQDNLTIFNPLNETITIEIYAINGQLLITNVIHSGKDEFDFQHFASGPYLLKWRSSSMEKIIRIEKL